MELEQREREAERVIADLHQKLQMVEVTASPEKLTGHAPLCTPLEKLL